MALNITVVDGYLTAEPKQDYEINGEPFIRFRLGCHRDKGHCKQNYDFVSFRAYKHNMDLIMKYVQTGQPITILARNRSFLRGTSHGKVPVEYKEVEKVYFDKRRDEFKELDEKEQEILEISKNYDGFDENGLFPDGEEEDIDG